MEDLLDSPKACEAASKAIISSISLSKCDLHHSKNAMAAHSEPSSALLFARNEIGVRRGGILQRRFD